MKNKIITAVFGALAMMMFNVAHADAQSELENCRSGAGNRYDECNARENYAKNCDTRYDRAMDSCQSRYSDRSQAERGGATYDYNGRFVPAQIPQRPGY